VYDQAGFTAREGQGKKKSRGQVGQMKRGSQLNQARPYITSRRDTKENRTRLRNPQRRRAQVEGGGRNKGQSKGGGQEKGKENSKSKIQSLRLDLQVLEGIFMRN